MGAKEVIAAFLIKNKGGNILIETGPASCLPTLLNLLKANKVKPASIKHVFITHIHLDHAGAAWYFAELGAQIYVHPNGLKHLKQPEKLWNSAKRIYGKDMEKLWGEMRPIPAHKLTAAKDGYRIKLNGQNYKAMHTPGHAIHHIAWQCDELLFAGDVAGVKINDGPAFPPCPPPDINVEDWRKSIRKIKVKRFSKLYLTHFGVVNNPKTHLVELEGRLNNLARWIYPFWESGTSQAKTLKAFTVYMDGQMKAAGVKSKLRKQYELANPYWMSVAGLMRYWEKKN